MKGKQATNNSNGDEKKGTEKIKNIYKRHGEAHLTLRI